MESSLPGKNVTKMLFSPDDSRLLVFTQNGRLLIFDTGSGKELNHCLFSDSRLRFYSEGRYRVVSASAGQNNRLLIIYDDVTFDTSVAITLDADTMEETGIFAGICAYFPQSNSVLVKPYQRIAFIRPLYSVEEMQEIAEKILGQEDSPR
jgi:hypothetical protein